MIWVYIARLWRDLLRAIIPPHDGQGPRQVDLESKCAACGHGPMKIECVTVTSSSDVNRPGAVRKALLMWTCAVCGGIQFTNPLCGTDPDKIHGKQVVGV